MVNVRNLMKDAESLSASELKLVADKIMKLLHASECEPSCVSQSASKCRNCGTEGSVIKFGKDKNGKQRYKCKCCAATFTDTSYSVVSHSHCSTDKWMEYIKLLLMGTSLAKTAEICGISVRTAFIWRHKILSVLQKDQDNRVMNGIIEADDMFFSISYKGNHSKSKKFTMPRKSYQRGNDNTAPLCEKVCVMCAIERKGNVYGGVIGLGAASTYTLKHVFDDRILDDSIVVTDKASGLKKYFETRSLEHIQTAARINSRSPLSPPEIKGVYHIQNVNNLHHRFRRFMHDYNGVATKYLSNYLNLYIWIENHKNIDNIKLDDALFDYTIRQNNYIPTRLLFNLPPTPSVA